MAKKLVMPGLILKNRLEDYNIKVPKLSEDIGLSQSAVRQILSTRVKISTEVGLRLAKYFGDESKYWLDLQSDYDVAELKNDAKFSADLKAIKKAKKQPAEAVSSRSSRSTSRRKASADAPKRPRRKKAVQAEDADNSVSDTQAEGGENSYSSFSAGV